MATYRPSKMASPDRNASPAPLPTHADVAIVGAGFAGLGTAVKLRQAGRHDFVVLERADEVGGTWEANTYPGCQCDVPSNLYSFSFAPKPDWSRTFALQPEIWGYLRGVADDFGLRGHLRLGCELELASWDEGARLWRLETSRGTMTARILVAAHGRPQQAVDPRAARAPRLRGGRLPHRPLGRRARPPRPPGGGDRHRRLGGAGGAEDPARSRAADGLPAHPALDPAPPRPPGATARAAPVPPVAAATAGASRRPSTGAARPSFSASTAIASAASRGAPPCGTSSGRCRTRSCGAPLTPDYEIGCKRILLSDDYFPALQQPNVELVADPGHGGAAAGGGRPPTAASTRSTRSSGAPAFAPPRCAAGERFRGRDGRLLGDVWAEGGMRALRGTTVAGFPNLFLLIGPNTLLGHNSVVFIIESQLAYLMDALETMDAGGTPVLDTRPEAAGRLQRGASRSGCAAPSGSTAAAPAGTSTSMAATRPSGPALHGASDRRPAGSTRRSTCWKRSS